MSQYYINVALLKGAKSHDHNKITKGGGNHFWGGNGHRKRKFLISVTKKTLYTMC